MKKVLFALTLALLAFGCTKVEEGGVPFGKNTLRVSSDEATRTAIVTDDNVTFRHNWVKGDAIALFDARDILKYEMVGDGGSTVADFTGEAPVKQQAPYYAVYPYKDNIDIYNDATNQSKFLYNFPAEIEYDGTAMAGSNVMIGFTDGKYLNMKNACSYVCLKFSSPYLCFVKSIEITAKGGEALAGPHLVGIDANGVPFTEVFNDKECSSTVKVVFPGDKMLTANTDIFYIPLPAVDLSAGLSFVLNGDFGGEPSLNLTSSTATLERNTVLVMEEYRLPSEEAKIGDVIYETVADAFKAANASDEDVTITLLRSCMAGERLTIGNGGTGDVTLNLNGKTLTTTTNNYVLANGRNLTVTDLFSDDPEKQGTITTDSGNTSQYVVRVENSGNLNWLKGNLTCTEYRPLYITSNSTATLSGGTVISPKGIAIALGSSGKSVTIDGDVLVEAPTNNAVYLWGGNLYVSDGYITNGSGSAVYSYGANAVAVVSGGYIDGFAANPVSAATGGAKAYVTGGCFTKAIFSIYSVDPDGNVYLNDLNPDPATNEKYPFMVVPKTGEPVAHGARTAGTPYWDFASIESAVLSAATTAGANILTLLQDVSTDVTLDFANTYATTFDLNGKKITSSASPALSNSKGTLTILDGSDAATGEVSTTGQTALEVKGNTTFSSGSLVAANNAVAVTSGSFKVFDGWFFGGTSDVTGSGNVSLAGGFYKNKPDDAYVTEDGIAASQLSPAESHNGRNYNWTIKRDYAEITMGSTLNAAIKTLANGSSLAYTYQDQAVTKIVFKVNQDLSGLTGGVDVSTPKDGSVILTFDGGVATISTNYQKLRSNDNISYTFRDFRELTRVEGFELIDTRNATNSRNLVYCAMKLEYINVSKMNTSNITNMTSMFCDAPALTQEVFDFSNWDTGNVETMNYMFDSVSVETLDLSAFDTKKVTTMAMMFTNCFNLKNLNISSFNTANVTTLDNMFEDCQKLESLDLRHFVTTKVTDLRSFCNRCYALKTIDLSSFNTKSVGRFSWMFNDCQELETIIVGPNFSGDKATTLQETFRNCYKLKNIDMSHFVSSSALTTCSYTFYECRALQSIDLSKLVTTNVSTFSSMFYNCKSITSINMSNATCKGLNPDGSNNNYNSTGGFYYMFYGCTNLEYLDIRSFVYPGKTTYMHMLEGCVNMKTLHIDNLGDISTYRYVNDYNLSVGSLTAGTLLGYNATPESPCVIYSNSAVLIRMLMFNRNYNNTGQYMNYGYAIRQYCGAGKIVFKKTGFNNPWTFTGWDPATATGAPTLDNIVAPTE